MRFTHIIIISMAMMFAACAKKDDSSSSTTTTTTDSSMVTAMPSNLSVSSNTESGTSVSSRTAGRTSSSEISDTSDPKKHKDKYEYFCTTHCIHSWLDDNLESIIDHRGTWQKILEKLIRS